MDFSNFKRTDALFYLQMMSAGLSATLSIIQLRRAFGQEGLLARITIREHLKKYYWIGIALIVLLTIGVIVYFRFVKHQIDEEDNKNAANLEIDTSFPASNQIQNWINE